MAWIILISGLPFIALLVVRLNQQRQHIQHLKADLHFTTQSQVKASKSQIVDTILREGVIEVLDDALLILDDTRVILYANQAAIDLFKRPCINQTLMLATRHFELDNLVGIALDHVNEVQERRLMISERILQVRVLNKKQYLFVVLHDVTLMQQLSRARKEMIANISHELNTPITTVSLLADTLLGGAAAKPDILTKMLENIKAETETLTQLVQEMRDLSLIESGQMPIKMIPTNMLTLIQQSVYPLLPIAERKGQNITINVDGGVIVLADEKQIGRVVKNIVHNAIKFTPDGGTIHIEAVTNLEEIMIKVVDSGMGIPQSALPRIFERFFQADPSRHQGTGLGLAIARHIVLGHGGTIHAENNLERGATFSFTLPQATPSDIAAH